ncbi:hypothetical protein [Candidatus Uabimicrobium sp. HlEnr_7]|uniref:hypothetical protein n=1 Tax=Candidatus Uabimicrobium helgolandensis TaxID=3095367 RepID=UPI003558AA80
MNHKKDYKKKPKKPTQHSSKVKYFMRKYHMDEATALEIATGVVPIELWLEKQRLYKQNMVAKKKLQHELKKFTPNGTLTINNIVQILGSSFSSEEYQKQHQNFVKKEEEILELTKKYEMPIPIAKSIIDKKFTLEEYFKANEQKEIRKEKALQIKKAHADIPLETCYKLIDNNLNVDEYIEQQDLKEKKRGIWYKNYLKDRLQDNEPLNNYLQKLKKSKSLVTFHLYDMKSKIGIVHSYTPYELKILCNRKLITIPKLDIKYFCRDRNNELILKSLTINRDLQKSPILPSKNPQERFKLPLEELKKDTKIEIFLGEGEQVTGYIDWFSKYDIKMKLQPTSRYSLMIFQHAITNINILT